VSKVFIEIANTVGKFVFFDEKTLRWNNKRLAWILVEVDLDLGLPKEI
jgi:hypothetical protein